MSDVKANEEEAKPLAIAKSFDSFDATMRLMAQTGEIDEFKEYITQTQKMRAYKGKIESTSPLFASQPGNAKPAPAPAPAKPPKAPKPKAEPAPEKKAPPRAPPMPQAASNGTALASNMSNIIMITAIVVLVVAAIGLLIALAIR
jgi:hypothetical protein